VEKEREREENEEAEDIGVKDHKRLISDELH
jgi:hypothetical protein